MKISISTLCARACFIVALCLCVSTVFAMGRGNGPIIFVTGQGLYFDSIVTADPLPPRGPFQKLEVVDGRLQTEFGPGDKGYVGGRWWMDTNNNGEMDRADKYFSCPLLGPGRSDP